MLLKRAATLWNIKPATARQQIKNGRIYADKIGRDWHVSEAEVRRYARDSQHREFVIYTMSGSQGSVFETMRTIGNE